MSGGSYWVCDAEGRVLGPLGLQVLTELVAASRIRDISGVSRDGETWFTLEVVPEVASLFQGPSRSAREEEEARKAAQLSAQLAVLRSKPAHEALGVAPHATVEEHRTAFFALAKRFHPARLPPGTHPDLREACFQTFQFLSDLMQAVEARSSVKPARTLVASDARPAAPRYEVGDFVGLSRGGDGIEATVRVTPRTASIFTEHHTVNLNNDGVFLPTRQHLPLGTLLNVNLIFDNAKKIRSRARVVWENANENARTKLGVGVRLLSLEKHDRQFIKEYLNGSARRGEPVGG